MKKYLTIAKAEWLDSIQSYQEVVLWIIIQLVPIIIMSALWSSSGNILSGSEISYLVTYYILIFVIDRLTGFYFEQHLQDEIRDGTFSRYLLKPIPIGNFLLWDNLGGKAFNTLFLLLPVLFIIYFLFGGHFLFPHSVNLALFSISVVIAFFIQFFLAVIVAAGAFFIEQAFALNHLHWMLDAVAGGYMLPLSFFPVFLQKFFSFLPFSYVYYTPVSIFTGQLSVSGAVPKILFSAFWVVLLYFLSNWLWNTGIRKYSSVGG